MDSLRVFENLEFLDIIICEACDSPKIFCVLILVVCEACESLKIFGLLISVVCEACGYLKT